MDKKIKYLTLTVTALIALVFIFLFQNGEEFFELNDYINNPVNLPLSNEVSYTEAFNKVIIETQEKRKQALKNKTPEVLVKEDLLKQRLIDMSKTAIKPITFYGKVVDQNGDPVSGVIVKHVGHNAVYSTGSGLMLSTTDKNGSFIVDDAEGSAFTIENLSKEGYEFSGRQRFSNSPGQSSTDPIWSNYTKGNPYIFQAWKVKEGVYPKISEARTTYGYKVDKIYSMDFLISDRRKVKQEGVLDLDLQVLFGVSESAWKLKLTVPNGGLIETEDAFLNLAPESGYQQTINYNGTKKDHMVPKKFYIHSRGKYYGRLLVEIRPYMRKGSGLGIDHVINLNGDRNLEKR